MSQQEVTPGSGSNESPFSGQNSPGKGLFPFPFTVRNQDLKAGDTDVVANL